MWSVYLSVLFVTFWFLFVVFYCIVKACGYNTHVIYVFKLMRSQTVFLCYREIHISIHIFNTSVTKYMRKSLFCEINILLSRVQLNITINQTEHMSNSNFRSINNIILTVYVNFTVTVSICHCTRYMLGGRNYFR